MHQTVNGGQREVCQMQVGIPLRELPASGSQNELSQIQNQTAVFGNGNELAWRNHSLRGVLPADECLGTHDAPVALATLHNLRLLVQQGLVVGQPVANGGFQLHTTLQSGLHSLLKQAGGVAAPDAGF